MTSSGKLTKTYSMSLPEVGTLRVDALADGSSLVNLDGTMDGIPCRFSMRTGSLMALFLGQDPTSNTYLASVSYNPLDKSPCYTFQIGTYLVVAVRDWLWYTVSSTHLVSPNAGSRFALPPEVRTRFHPNGLTVSEAASAYFQTSVKKTPPESSPPSWDGEEW